MEPLGKLHLPAATSEETWELETCGNDRIGKVGVRVRFQLSVNNKGVSTKSVAVHTKKKKQGGRKILWYCIDCALR